MARKTREDYLREKEIQARVDLVRAGRGGRWFRNSGQYLGHAAETENQVLEARQAGKNWQPRMPAGMDWFGYAVLIGLLGFIGYLILVYGGLG